MKNSRAVSREVVGNGEDVGGSARHVGPRPRTQQRHQGLGAARRVASRPSAHLSLTTPSFGGDPCGVWGTYWQITGTVSLSQVTAKYLTSTTPRGRKAAGKHAKRAARQRSEHKSGGKIF